MSRNKKNTQNHVSEQFGMTVLEWLVRLLNASFDMGVVPMDLRGACIVLLYKGKGEKCECGFRQDKGCIY